MDATVNHRCASCGTAIETSVSQTAIGGVGLLRELSVDWTCPECGVEYDKTLPVDMDLLERSGFCSWTNHVDGQKACIVIDL